MKKSGLKIFLNNNIPFYSRVNDFVKKQRFRVGGLEKRFEKIYRKGVSSELESASGLGSSLEHTEVVRAELPKILAEYNIKSILDIPCGDFYWMKMIELPVEKYIGADIVTRIIEHNKNQYGNTRREFMKLDLTRDKLPGVQLVFSRDCLVHLSNDNVFRAINNIKQSGAEYFLTTTFPGHDENVNIYSSDWRPINFEKAPFNFPPPIKLVKEQCPLKGYEDKSLGLWRVSDLPD